MYAEPGAGQFLAGGRTLPNREGLQITQILEAVRFAGYSSHMIFLGRPGEPLLGDMLERARRLVYTYVESEIPVVLALLPTPDTGHAVVLIGHGWNDASLDNIQTSIGAHFFAKHAVSWVDHFFIHNDNAGPYIKFELDSDDSYSLKHAAYAIPLLPSDVFMSGEEAEKAAAILIEQVLSGSFNEDQMRSILDKLVIRTYLTERYRFREWVRKSALTKEISGYYRLKPLPKRIWVTEMNLIDNYNSANTGGALRIGEILIDATGDPHDAPFLSFHINLGALGIGDVGIVIDRDPVNSNKIEIYPFPDSIYSALQR